MNFYLFIYYVISKIQLLTEKILEDLFKIKEKHLIQFIIISNEKINNFKFKKSFKKLP
jgi:hypothetical protein